MSERAISWLLFFINPFISLLLAIKNYSKPYSKDIFWAFCVFFGFTFAIGTENSGSDINRYVEDLQFFYSQSSLSISEIINYFDESGEIDIFNIVVTYFVSRFSDSRAVLTMVYAIFFGYFYSRNIWYIFSLLNHRPKGLVKLLLFSLILLVPIWYINGIRMYLAFHVFFYGLLPFIFKNKNNKLIYLYGSFLIHFSFLLPIGLFLVYRFLGNRLNLYFFGFLFSLIVSGVNLGSVNSYMDRFAPQRVQERTSSYSTEEVVEARNIRKGLQTKRWYVKWHSLGFRWAMFILVIYIYVFGNNLWRINPDWRRLVSITLLFLTMANLVLNMASGVRFMIFALFLSLVLIILYLDQFLMDYKFKLSLVVLSPAIILFVIISLRMSLYSMSLTTITGNPLISLFNTNETLSLNDLIKWKF